MKSINKYKKYFLCCLILGCLFFGAAAYADDAGLVNWPNSPLGTPLSAESELHELIAYIYEWAISLGGLAVFIVLIYAGVQYLTSTGKPEIMRDARDRIRSAIIGLILLLSIWLILNTISPRLTELAPIEVNLADVVAGTTCDNNDNDDCETKWGPGFICQDNYCVMEANTELIQCEEVTLTWEGDAGEETRTVGLNAHRSVQINPGASISYETTPEGCRGMLELYPKSIFLFRCRGQYHEAVLTTNQGSTYSPEETQCVVLREIPPWW